jgi:DNA repair protein RecN (Recombination protein N)
MLQSLSIRNFALIEHLQVDWKPGLNVLTGETGAGKSILIDAISILLGAKVGAGLIRIGAEKAQIEGVFRLSPQVLVWLKEQELADGDSHELIVAREISKSGSRFRINGTLINQAVAQELRQFLISLHVQHEARTLLSAQAQLEMLDALGDKAHSHLATTVRALWSDRKELDGQLKDLQISEEERLSRLDFARFQLSELTEAQLLEADEDAELARQARILSNVVSLGSCLMNAQQALVGGRDDTSGDNLPQAAVDTVQTALSEVERGAKLDSNLEAVSSLLKNSLADIEEAATRLRRYHDSLEADPEALQAIESRIGQLAMIKRKYGPSLKDAIERRQALEPELERLENTQVRLDELNSKRASLTDRLEGAAKELSQRRRALAKKLAKRVEADLVELGMERCRFEVSIEPQLEAGPNGTDRVEFLIAPNPGQPLLPLAKIASGGELSRIMLVIKSIFAEADQVATVVFDEIDTGLSGRVLQAMRDRLAALAKSHQILCITHQPLIAAIADNHLHIQKQQTAKTTAVSAKVLIGEDRLKALAEMASGEENEEVAINFARSLISQANQARSN